MTIKDLINTAKFDFNIKNNDYTQKNHSKDATGTFLNVFESANKSYNFSFDKSERFSYKNLNQYNENKSYHSKEFKSEYENFYNKFDNKKNSEISTRKTAVSETKKTVAEAKAERKEIDSESKKAVAEAKAERKEVGSDTKETVKEAKAERKETVSDAKKAVADAKEEKKDTISELNNTSSEDNIDETDNISNNTVIIGQADILNTEETINPVEQTDELSQNSTITDISTENSNDSEIETNNTGKNSQEELTSIQKQIANEKILNKQAENLLKQEQTPQPEELTENQEQAVNKNQDNTELKASEQPSKQAESEKIKVLASDDVLNKLDNIDKSHIKSQQNLELKPTSDKTAEIINNQDSKPVITNIEIQNNSSKMDFDGKNQGQSKQDLSANINQTQSASSSENNLPKIDIQKTSQFDKIINAKQSQSTESSVLNQLKDKLSADMSTNKSQITLSLRPESLGKVDINLVSKNGVLTAQITAENKQVKDILSKGLETLKQHMTEQGINVGKMSVNVQESQSSNQNMDSEGNLNNFEQSNSNTSDMSNQSGMQNHTEESSTTFANNELYELEEEMTSEANETNGQTPAIIAGKVDYKV